ncbi:hypothetical protein GOODEAATRI_000122 [Goodea atripinnis]|uniref:Nucleoporin Nup133/Nup155-like N-terminal domain-containing protein n=1 Tax=Goodea atripinnis TaxID=208336 RepID=A0ABV0ME30_9TELE
MPSAAGASSPAAALAEALDNSARLIDRHLQDDRYFPDLSELLSVPSHNQRNLLCSLLLIFVICRAWLTIDNDIFMWNYEDGLLLPDPLFSIPTDNTYILSITSTDLGRIFMAGKDGCLYEIAYQAEAGWLSQRCRKINHSKSSLSFLIPSVLQFSFSEDDPIVQIAIDNSRNTLFTRSEKDVLQVYDLGADGQGMSRVATMSQSSIVAAAGNIARTIDRSVFRPIVQISVIDRSESSDCHLLAVTHAGVRLYFTTTPFAPQHQKHVAVRPSLLALVHVRLPPGFSASSTLQKPSKVHKALHSKGVLLMAASETEDSDILWCINHDSFPFKKPLMETQGSHIFQKLRPVDQLRHLLVSCAGGESEEVERFFKLHRVLLLYGGEAQMRFPAAMATPSTVGPVMSSPAPGVVPPAFGTPFAPMQSGSAPITPMSAGPEVIFSGKHNGICIYFARILG